VEVTRRGLWVLALALALAMQACADLPAIEHDHCGNAVLDPGEDCDTHVAMGLTCGGPSAGAGACHFLCEHTASGHKCPDGFGCGGDGVCRPAGGAYEETDTSGFRMPSEGISIGDFNGDGAPDLASVDGETLTLRFGPSFSERTDYGTALRSGAPVLADMDQNGRPDLVMPLRAGVFTLLGRSDGSLAPVAYAPFVIPMGNDPRMLVMDADPSQPGDEPLAIIDKVMFFVPPKGDPMRIGVLLPPKPDGMPFDSSQIVDRVPIADLDGDGLPEFVLPFEGAHQLFIYGVRVEQIDGMAVTRPYLRWTVPLPGALLHGVRLTDLDGDGKLDLLVSVDTGTGSSTVSKVAVAHWLGASPNPFEAAAVDPVFDQMIDKGCSYGDPWPLAVGQLNFDPPDPLTPTVQVKQHADFVGNLGVCITSRDGRSLTLAASTRRSELWTEAAIADFNRDGAPDVAAASDQTTGVDFLLGSGLGGFNTFTVDTSAPVTMLRPGDYDGDYVQDLAVVLRTDLDRDVPQELAVLYGRLQGAPATPVTLARFDSIIEMEQGSAALLGSTDAITDLMVEAHPQGGSASVAVLIGTTQRTLLSPFTLSVDMMGGVPTAVAGGELTGDNMTDVVAITAATRDAPAAAVLLQGTGGGQLSKLSDTPLPPGRFETRCALLGTARLDGTIDTIFAIDGAPTRACEDSMHPLDPAAITPHLATMKPVPGGAPTIQLAELGGDFVVPAQMLLGDVTGDGVPDLVVRFAGDDQGQGAGIMIYPTVGGTVRLDQGHQVTGLTGEAYAIALLQADRDPARELAILTAQGIELADLSSDGTPTLRSEPAVSPNVPFLPGTLSAGDVDNDGVDDLVVTQESVVRIFAGLREAP
jgi:hypothetical protein